MNWLLVKKKKKLPFWYMMIPMTIKERNGLILFHIFLHFLSALQARHHLFNLILDLIPGFTRALESSVSCSNRLTTFPLCEYFQRYCSRLPAYHSGIKKLAQLPQRSPKWSLSTGHWWGWLPQFFKCADGSQQVVFLFLDISTSFWGWVQVSQSKSRHPDSTLGRATACPTQPKLREC